MQNSTGTRLRAFADYFDAIGAAARQRGFESCKLGELVRSSEIVLVRRGDTGGTRCSGSRGPQRYGNRGGGSVEEGATQYFKMKHGRKAGIGSVVPAEDFITFNNSKYRCLFPDSLPIFYMYSLRHGVSVKPWFLPPVVPMPSLGDQSFLNRPIR